MKPATTRHRRNTGRRDAFPWWSRPVPVLLAVSVPSALATAFLSPAEFATAWQEPKVFTVGDLEWCLWIVTLMAVCIGLGRSWVGRRDDAERAAAAIRSLPVDRLRWVFTVLFRITAIGYIVWLGVALHRGVRLSDFLQVVHRSGNSVFSLKAQLTSVSGVTTIVEVGIAAATVGSYCLFVAKDRSVRRRLIVLVVIVALRAVLNSERQALIEILIPIGMVWLGSKVFGGQVSRRLRRGMLVFPLVALVALLAYFGSTEYFRSYVYYSKTESTSLVPYTVSRFEGYYITSYNDAALLDQYYFPQYRVPYFTIEAFWRAPVVSTLLPYSHFEGGVDSYPETQFIYANYGNPNFNNASGLMVPRLDYGPIGGSIFIAVFATGIGILYGLWRHGSITGLLFYPFIVTGLVDFPREFYWTSGSSLPAIAALAWAAMAIKGDPRKGPQHRALRRKVRDMPDELASATEQTSTPEPSIVTP